jgi:tetratricopeptide (TPR) repeat protein
LARSKEYFEQAIALDAAYADPHMALASSYLHLAVESLRPAREVMPLVREEGTRARDLNPSEPGVDALLGAVATLYDYHWDTAAERFRLAMTSGSGLPGVRQCYVSFFLVPSGRFPEAVEELARELKQDPLNVAYRAFQAGHLGWAGLYERGIEEARAALEIENHWLPHYVIAENYAERGMLTEALAAAESARQLAPWNARVAGVLAAILTRTGERDRAAELRRELKAAAPIGMVVYHILCSELDAAADWYEKCIEQREPFAVMYARTAIAAPLRSSARWPALAKSMNLP